MTRAAEQTQGETNKRRRRWIAGLIALSLLIAVISFPFIILRSQSVRQLILDDLVERLGWGDQIELSLSNIDRFDPTGFSFNDLQVSVRDYSGTNDNVITIDNISASWSLLSLMRWRAAINSISIDTVAIDMDLLHLLKKTATPAKADLLTARRTAGGLPRAKIKLVEIGPIDLNRGDDNLYRFSTILSEVETSHNSIELLLNNSWASLEQMELTINAPAGELSWSREGTGYIRGMTLLSDDLRGRLDATYDATAENRYSLSLSLDKLNPAWITKSYLPRIDPWPDDSLTGMLFIEAGNGHVYSSVDLSGRLQGESLNRGQVNVEIYNKELFLRDLNIDSQAGQVAGDLFWHIPERRGEAGLIWSNLDLQTTWLPWVNSIPSAFPFAGTSQVTVFAPADSQVTVSGQVELFRCEPWDVDVDQISCRGEVRTEEGVFLEQVKIDLPGGGIRGDGFWPLNDHQVDISATIDSLMLAVLPIAWRQNTTGQVSGHTHISGISDDPVFEGSLQISDLRRGAWRADLLSAGSLLFWPRDIRGSGNLELWRLQNGDGSAANMNLRFSRWDNWISLDTDIRLPKAEIHLTGRFDPEAQLQVEEGSFAIPDWDRWRLQRPWTLAWSADSLVADSLCFASDESNLCLGGHWIGSSKEIEANVDLVGFDLAGIETLLGGERSFKGTCGLRIDAVGSFPDPRVSLEFACDSLGIGPFELGTANLGARWQDQSLSVGPVTLISSQQEVALPEVKLAVGRPLTNLLGLEGDRDEAGSLVEILGHSPWKGNLQIDRLDLSRWAHVLGLRSGDGDSSLRNIEMVRSIGGRQVPIRIEAPWDLQPASTGTGSLSGILSSQISIAGSPADPVLGLRGHSNQLLLAGLPVGSLEYNLTYADSALTMNSLSLIYEENRSWVQGSYPYAIGFLPLATGALPDTVSVEATLAKLNLALLSGFLRYLPDAEGELEGNISVGGTGISPLLSGHLKLNNGGCRIPGRSERIYGARAEAEIRTDRLVIPICEASSGARGTLSGSGAVQFDGSFDFRGQGTNIQVFEQGQYDFIANADSLHAWRKLNNDQGDDPVGSSEPILAHLTGNIELLQGNITPDLSGNGASAGGKAKELPWLIDLNVSVPSNIRVSQTNAKVRIGEGDLRLAYRPPFWNISGSLNIADGNYRLFNNNFIIQSGTLDFRDSGTGPDVTVAIKGETFVVAASPQSSVGEEGDLDDITIEVSVQGKPENLQVSLSSVPPLSPEEIVELLSYGRFINSEGNFTAASTTQNMLFNTLVERVEQNLAEQFPLFTHVGIEPGLSGDGTRLSVRPVITPAFTGNYTQELSLDPAWELSLYYRLSRMLYLRAGVARDRQGTAGFDDEYSLDLKCRFEY